MTEAKAPTFTLTEVPDVWIAPAILALLLGLAAGAVLVYLLTAPVAEDRTS
jgi:hypothetical protein